VKKQRWLVVCGMMAVIALPATWPIGTVSADEWRPISQEELKMTSVAESPGAPAVILYRQVDRADKLYGSKEFNYIRIKVLTEAGRKYANVDIPIQGDKQTLSSIRGRTIHPDGSIANFDGKVYEQTIVKAKGIKYLAKTFTLPDVQLGSIIEYQYYLNFPNLYFYNARWVLNEELFTKIAKFSMDPYTERDITVRWDWPAGLPEGTKPPAEGARGILRMEVKNIPAFEAEDNMPPQNELKQRVEFIYSNESLEPNYERFWKRFEKKEHGKVEVFCARREFLTRVTNETVGAADGPQAKLEKIYARVQQTRDISYELRKTSQEKKQEGLKENSNVEDVWKNGEGSKRQINWLFLGMVRAAGIEASPVLISNRKYFFFRKERMDTRELTQTAVLVRVDGREKLLDPGAYHAPLGLLPWEETGVSALKLDGNGGAWFQTELGKSEDSQIQRKADLKLTEDGTLEGQLTLIFTGQESYARRIDEMREDDQARKKSLEDQVKAFIPVGSEVELIKQPDWTGYSPTLVAELHLKVPAWANAAGKRLLLPVGLFSNGEKHTFDHSGRHSAIYFEYPNSGVDQLEVTIPDGWQVLSVPDPKTTNLIGARFNFLATRTGNTLHLKRELAINFVLMEQKFYPALRTFYHTVKSRDDEQVVLQAKSAVPAIP